MNAREQLAFYIGYEKGEDDPRFERLVDAVIAERDAEIVAWLVKKAREVRATPKSKQESPADTLARMASKIQRGAVRPNNLRMLPATPTTEPDLYAAFLAAVQGFRSTASGDSWSQQFAQHLLTELAPHIQGGVS